MRVGIIALLQESNTFLDAHTTLAHFEQDLLLTGENVRRALATAHHEVGGFFQGLDEQGIEAVPLLAARATPFGTMTAETLDRLLEMILFELRRAGPLDGLLLAPHGATVAQSQPDADGYWVSRVREFVGPAVPLVATLDPHANLSEQLVRATDALIAYRTNPHLDQRDRGIEAAVLLARTLRGEVRPTQAAAFPPMAVNIEAQHTTEFPCAALGEHADEIRAREGVLSVSLLLGFPYADVPQMGSATVVVTNDNPRRARDCAEELAMRMWELRRELSGRLVGIEEALDQLALLNGTVGLLDMGDNVGGGSPGDGMALARALHQRRMPATFVCLYDPAAVRAVEAAGVGAKLSLQVGGKTDPRQGPPLIAEFEVCGRFEGVFQETEPRHGGIVRFDQGRTAVVRTDYGLTVMLTLRRAAPFSLHQLTDFGIDPTSLRAIVIKGVHAPVAAYRSVCRHFLRVNTPGVTTADMTTLPYRHRRTPMYPFEPEIHWP